MLQKILEAVATVQSVLAFAVTVVEAIYEGQQKKGDEKKKLVLEQIEAAKPHIRAAVVERIGERWGIVVDILLHPVVVGFLIDLLVLWFNRAGIFRTSA